MKLLSLPALVSLFATSGAFSSIQERMRPTVALHTSKTEHSIEISRHELLQVAIGATLGLAAFPSMVSAGVGEGDLPKGAAQFNRILRIRKDLKKIRTRVSEAANELDKTEWDNIGGFLRRIYKTAGEDMTAIASGIKNAENKKIALEDSAKLQKYAQASDVIVNKQDANAFVDVADKMIALTEDYFQRLVDVPEEI